MANKNKIPAMLLTYVTVTVRRGPKRSATAPVVMMPNTDSIDAVPNAVAASSAGKPCSTRYTTVCTVTANMPTEVKKNIQVRPQKLDERSARAGVHSSALALPPLRASR